MARSDRSGQRARSAVALGDRQAADLVRGRPGWEPSSKSGGNPSQVEQDNPGPGRQRFSLPAGITVEGATPTGEGRWCDHSGAPPTPARCRTSGKKQGVAPSTSSPSCAAPRRAGDTPCAAQPRLSQPTRGIRANPPPIRLSRQGPDHSSEGAPSEREALWLPKA